MGQQRESGAAAGWRRHPRHVGTSHPEADGGDERRRARPRDLPGSPHLISELLAFKGCFRPSPVTQKRTP